MQWTLFVGAMALAGAGCYSTGLSPHQSSGQDYSLHALAMYDQPEAQGPGPVKLTLPARVAVAQVGEVAPPEAMLERLRGDGRVFSKVEGIPSADSEANGARRVGTYGEVAPSPDRATAREDMRKMEEFSRSIGCDYLLVCGGNIAYGSAGNAMTVLDLTVVGAFVVPSQEIRAEARANAAMIDLKTRRVVLSVSASEVRTHKTPSAALALEEQNLLVALRDSVVAKLSKAVLVECRQRSISNEEAP